jgi:hypothetical protein
MSGKPLAVPIAQHRFRRNALAKFLAQPRSRRKPGTDGATV